MAPELVGQLPSVHQTYEMFHVQGMVGSYTVCVMYGRHDSFVIFEFKRNQDQVDSTSRGPTTTAFDNSLGSCLVPPLPACGQASLLHILLLCGPFLRAVVSRRGPHALAPSALLLSSAICCCRCSGRVVPPVLLGICVPQPCNPAACHALVQTTLQYRSHLRHNPVQVTLAYGSG